MSSIEGDKIRRRRLRLGLDVLPFAHEAGVDRETLTNIENGRTAAPRPSSLRKIHAKLDELEVEHFGHVMPEPEVEDVSERMVEFEVTGDFGVRVMVRGPVADAAELEQTVAKLVRDIRERREDSAET